MRSAFVATKDVIHSWQKIDPASARYPPEITPLILAAQRNNYEILKLLLDRGATLPMPHDIKCGCADCLRSTTGKTLEQSYKINSQINNNKGSSFFKDFYVFLLSKKEDFDKSTVS